MTPQPSLWSAVPQALGDDAAWLAQVREDAGRWWASRRIVMGVCGNGTLDYCVLVYGNYRQGFQVHHEPSGEGIGGPWPDEMDARLFLWLVLAICSWQLVPDVATARATWGDALDAVEARLRAALGKEQQ